MSAGVAFAIPIEKQKICIAKNIANVFFQNFIFFSPKIIKVCRDIWVDFNTAAVEPIFCQNFAKMKALAKVELNLHISNTTQTHKMKCAAYFKGEIEIQRQYKHKHTHKWKQQRYMDTCCCYCTKNK